VVAYFFLGHPVYIYNINNGLLLIHKSFVSADEESDL